MLAGRAFHSLTVLGKYEYLWDSVRDCGMRNPNAWQWRVGLVVGMTYCATGIATSPLVILYIITSLEIFLRSWRVIHPSFWSSAVTLACLSHTLVVYRAARLCTISSRLILWAVCGSHMVAAYSRVGRTSVLNAFSFKSVDLTLMFLLRNPRTLFAFATVLSYMTVPLEV